MQPKLKSSINIILLIYIKIKIYRAFSKKLNNLEINVTFKKFFVSNSKNTVQKYSKEACVTIIDK